MTATMEIPGAASTGRGAHRKLKLDRSEYAFVAPNNPAYLFIAVHSQRQWDAARGRHFHTPMLAVPFEELVIDGRLVGFVNLLQLPNIKNGKFDADQIRDILFANEDYGTIFWTYNEWRELVDIELTAQQQMAQAMARRDELVRDRRRKAGEAVDERFGTLAGRTAPPGPPPPSVDDPSLLPPAERERVNAILTGTAEPDAQDEKGPPPDLPPARRDPKSGKFQPKPKKKK